MRLVIRKFIGVVLVIFGLFALVTPLTPGAFLGLIGLELLGLGFLIPRPVRGFWNKWKVEAHAWWLRREPLIIKNIRTRFFGPDPKL